MGSLIWTIKYSPAGKMLALAVTVDSVWEFATVIESNANELCWLPWNSNSNERRDRKIFAHQKQTADNESKTKSSDVL